MSILNFSMVDFVENAVDIGLLCLFSAFSKVLKAILYFFFSKKIRLASTSFRISISPDVSSKKLLLATKSIRLSCSLLQSA